MKRANPEDLARRMREAALEQDGYRIITDSDLEDLHEALAKIYYHAGRYAAGAIDGAARLAHIKFERIVNANS